MLPTSPEVSFDSAYAAYKEWIGWDSTVVSAPRRGPGRPSRREKIVIAGDFHVPFHHRGALNALIREEAKDTDLLVVNGDLGDFWSTSRFPKSKRLVDPCAEMAEAQAVLTLLSERFRRIKIIGGNHDSRPKKFLAEHLPPDVLDYIALTGPMVFRPLDFLAAGLNNVEVVEPVKSGYAEFAFLHQIGDLVCTHAETYSRIPNKAVGTVIQWIHAFGIPQGILHGPIGCVVEAHTHQAGTTLNDFGCLGIEGGCMSELQDYSGDPKCRTPRPLAQGWTRVYQEDGVTDRRESRFVPFA